MPIPFSRNLKGVDRYREFLRGVPNQIPAAICYLPLPNGFTSGKSLPLLLAKGLAQLLLQLGIDMKKFAAFLLGKLTPPVHQKNNIDKYMRPRVPRLVNMVNLD